MIGFILGVAVTISAIYGYKKLDAKTRESIEKVFDWSK